MRTFKVTITEFLKKTVVVEAETREDAIQKVADEHYAGMHVLEADDYADVEFDSTEEIGATYEVWKHFRDGMDPVFSTTDLLEALSYCLEDETLCSECGHAVSVHNSEGSIFEINYYGSKEIDVDGVATKEELKTIKAFVAKL